MDICGHTRPSLMCCASCVMLHCHLHHDLGCLLLSIQDLGVSFDGPIDLKSPQHILDLYLDYGTAKIIPERPLYFYFGRQVCPLPAAPTLYCDSRHLASAMYTHEHAHEYHSSMCPFWCVNLLLYRKRCAANLMAFWNLETADL